jgi:acyl carrier protein
MEQSTGQSMDLRDRLNRLSPQQRTLVAQRLAPDSVAVSQDQSGRLAAYVVAKEGYAPTSEELRRFLLKKLPDYMVPHITLLDAFPLTPNGKIDHKALPTAASSTTAEVPSDTEPDTAPDDPLHQVLSSIWAEILDCEQVGANDDFFALGGHSLMGTALIAQLRDAFQLEIPLRLLFDHPTVAKLATALRADPVQAAQVEKAAQLLLQIAELPEDEVAALLAQSPEETS